MTDISDRKMFAPLRRREAIAPYAKLFAVLQTHQAGMIAASLADALVHGGVVTGTRSLLVRRVGEILDELEQAGKVERIPDGRYRAVRGIKSV